MDAGEYLSKRLDALRNRSQEFYHINESVSNDFNDWTALKLILHSATVNMYTKVHQSQGTGDIFYIDALAGSGVSTTHKGRCFVGSPLIACRDAKRPFRKMYFIDSNQDYCDALERRLEHAFNLPEYTEPDDYDVINGDVNNEISKVVEEIWTIGDLDDRLNYYCFIDNQGMDFSWSSIEQLTPTPYGDFLINLPIAHAIGRSASMDNIKSLNDFYGGDMKRYAKGRSNRKQLKQEYCDRLVDKGRQIQTTTQVQTDIGSFYYDLIYATREIEGGNDYVDVIRYVRDFIERVHSGHVGRLLDVLDNNQETFEEFLPDDDLDEALPDESEDSDNDQSNLDDFS